MDNYHHINTGMNNVTETWDHNEKERMKANLQQHTAPHLLNEAQPKTELDQIVKEEANAYDEEAIENKLLGGNRATVNDV